MTEQPRTSHVVLNLSVEEADTLSVELAGVEEDLKTMGEEDRANTISGVLNKLNRSRQ